MNSTPIVETNLDGIGIPKRGKVRDIYDLEDYLLIVATDKVSAFDVIMPTPINDKGETLTRLSAFWFWYLRDIINNHLITMDVLKYPQACDPYREILHGRSMLVKKAKVIPIECIVRGNITGSGWTSYLENGTVCGIELPKGLREAEELSQPIFTPSTKAELGEHDENISFDELIKRVGRKTAERLREVSIALFVKAAAYAKQKGIIIADTKFEFGMYDGEMIFLDEALTPDSSRFWPEETYAVGSSPVSLDKQYIRDYLKKVLGWKSSDPAPELPADVVLNTRKKYLEAFERLTGRSIR